MEVFRITHTKWSSELSGSGYAARWNSNGFFVVYCAANCSLACLENLVHRNGFGNNSDYCLITIGISDTIKTITIKEKELPKGWNLTDENGHLICREIGDLWIKKQQSCVLIVPSAIIPNEKNVLINPNHKDFSKIKIKLIKPFTFDTRLYNQ